METQQALFQSYYRPKEANEPNLILVVRDILVKNNLTNNITEAFDNNYQIRSALNSNAEVQRFKLNLYWNSQLLSCEEDSTKERYVLIPNGEFSEWIDLFKTVIIPFCIRNSLPRIL